MQAVKSDTVTVQVDDQRTNGRVTSQITVQFTCLPPVFQPNAQPLQIRRGQCRGPQDRSIGFALATDQDGGDVTYALGPSAGTAAGRFTVNSQTGEIRTTADFTTQTLETLSITATDNEGATTTSNIQIQVNCQNQLPAFDSPTYRWVMSPQVCQQGGQFPTSVTATDPDGQPLTYEILSGDTNNQFTISADGTLTARQTTGDPPAGPDITLQIVARDDSLPTPGEARTTVTVDNSACVNSPPEFDQPTQQIQMRQCDGQTTPIQVGRATARDNDAQDTLQYTIISPTDNSYTITQEGYVSATWPMSVWKGVHVTTVAFTFSLSRKVHCPWYGSSRLMGRHRGHHFVECQLVECDLAGGA